ncbi:hypothetical protein FOL47_007115 [Perkinsus chesapeaki]|uniref:IBB domain-containing protein n=1 Tax=Perkinsus chesapeaki TaxID=330153 RepID=A0A7J6MWR5_PERCH|nr:hypothetical protein FOL47_007115 [Perkinsus chesapeaki]
MARPHLCTAEAFLAYTPPPPFDSINVEGKSSSERAFPRIEASPSLPFVGDHAVSSSSYIASGSLKLWSETRGKALQNSYDQFMEAPEGFPDHISSLSPLIKSTREERERLGYPQGGLSAGCECLTSQFRVVFAVVSNRTGKDCSNMRVASTKQTCLQEFYQLITTAAKMQLKHRQMVADPIMRWVLRERAECLLVIPLEALAPGETLQKAPPFKVLAQQRARLAARRRNFKKASGDANDMRRRREDATVQIRKKEKEEQLVRRRRLEMEAAADLPEASFNTPNRPSSSSQSPSGFKEEDIPALTEALNSSDSSAVMEALVSFRKLLSREDRPPIQNVIDAGVLPRFKELLDNPLSAKMQFEAAWALTNVASGNHNQTLTVVELGAVESFKKLLLSDSPELQEQSIWAIANIAGDGPGIRDQCLRLGVLQPLLDVIRAGRTIGLVRLGTWAVSNFCRGKPAPALSTVSSALATLAMVLGLDDRESLTDALWAVSYICDGPSERIEAVLLSGMIPRIVHLLKHENPAVHTPALRAIGNVVTGEAHQTAAAVDSGLIVALKPLLRSPKKTVRKEAVWTLSNICADRDIQIQKVIESGLLADVFEILLGAKEHEVRREAVWVICNLCTGGTAAQVRYVVDHYNAIPAICTVLEVKDSRIVQVALEAIETILKLGSQEQEKTGETMNRYLELLEECGGLGKIEELQEDHSKDVYERVVRILEGYCELEDENEAMGGVVVVMIANPPTESIEVKLKGLLTDTQAACWLVVAVGSYAVLSMAVIPLSVASVLVVGMIVGSMSGWEILELDRARFNLRYASSLAGIDLVIPEHAALFPGLDHGSSSLSEHISEGDEIASPEVTPRVPPSEPHSNRKRSIGSSGTTKASLLLEEDVPLETPDTTPMKLAMPTPPTMATSGDVGRGNKNGGRSEGHQLECEDPDVSTSNAVGRRSIPSTLRNALSFKGDEAMRFRVKGTFLHVEYPRGEDEMSDECNPPGASRDGSVDASVLSASEEDSVVADSSEPSAAGVRRFRRRRSISDADLTYTAYLAELAMEQQDHRVGGSEAEDSVEAEAAGSGPAVSSDATAPGEPVVVGDDVKAMQKPAAKGLNPNAPEFVPQSSLQSRPWLSIEAPPPGIPVPQHTGLGPDVYRQVR